MSRTSRYKAGYVAAFVSLALLCVAALYFTGWSKVTGIVLVLALLLPGRLQGVFFRDLFRGRRELDQGNPAAALPRFERFLATIRAMPWRRHLLWLSWSLYTPSVEAMTLNNIGSAHFALGENDSADIAWRAALARDPLYPIPYSNLALLAAARGDSTAAEELLASAKALGYSRGSLDRVVQQVQSLLAKSEAHGASA